MKKNKTRQTAAATLDRADENPQECTDLEAESSSLSSPGRRVFLGKVGAVATAAAGAAVLPQLAGSRSAEAVAVEVGPLNAHQRRDHAFRSRLDAALFNKGLPIPEHPTNGDEDLYVNQIGSYSKGLPHNDAGEVDLAAYGLLVNALRTGSSAAFDAIPMGAPLGQRVKLVNPQSALAFELEGADSHSLAQQQPPAFASAEIAAEIAENYWMALARDVHFADYATNPFCQNAISDLNQYSVFRGPRISGQVTGQTLFRGLTPGDLKGPYLSQFFLLPCFFGANELNQKIRTVLPPGAGGGDYMTDFATWLAVQRGFKQGPDAFDPTPRYIRNGRDLGQWVHVDVLFQAYLQAFLGLAGMGAPFDSGNPYKFSANQDGFGTFGLPHIATVLCEVSTRALHAVWYQKWSVHRRLRPEAFAGRIERVLNGGATYPVNAEILSSLDSASRLGAYFPNPGAGTFLLPMAFPEGSPLHPSYGAGHATVAGACVTILKAWFDESHLMIDLLPNLVEASADGLSLAPYTGADASTITVGDELNKLASNVAIGRNIAGVHWRSDATESLRLGEAVAISILRDQKACYNELFSGFTLTKFDGTTATI